MEESLKWPVSQRREYERHSWKMQEIVWELVKCAGIVTILSWFFYRSIWALLPMCIPAVLYWKVRGQEKARQDREELLWQFCDMIQSVAAAMKAGYSVENAFLESHSDMRLMHGEESVICRELEAIRRGLVMNHVLESLLEELGIRSGVEQIAEFCEVFAIARINGGNMTEIIDSTAILIRRSAETQGEIRIQTAARRMERNIMIGMPFLIVTYVESTNPQYFQPLYHNWSGVLIMSACLIVYLAAYWLSEHILRKAIMV